MMRLASPVGHAGLAAALLAAASAPFWADAYHLSLASKMAVLGLYALGLQLLVGGAGMVSLGQAGFFAIGAYTLHLAQAPGAPASILLTLPLAAAAAAAAAAAIGALALRTRSFFFLMVTLAFGQMIFFLFHDTPLGGSKDGVFVERPLLEAFGFAIEVPRRERAKVLLWLNLGMLAACYVGLLLLMRTLFGRALQGIRANEPRMRALGYDTGALKLAAFVLAGGISGIAGHMWAMTYGFVSPELAGWHFSAEALLIVLLGGIGALHGPILGAVAYVGLQEVASLLTERQNVVIGAAILAIVLLLPRGSAGLAPAPRPARP
ncbi:MAG: branched-chain amino acid ABC transporter permease, partial [Acetobacteraceae bacterium]|nr:branched-chain amino acid ABC transporter permease [Acetobacteraceae bacterium]